MLSLFCNVVTVWRGGATIGMALAIYIVSRFNLWPFRSQAATLY